MTNKRLYMRKPDKVGEQDISLAKGCGKKSTVLTQIMSALGFMKEHLRKDRDEHITINWDNVFQPAKYSFKKCANCETFGLPYDTESVTHFHGTAFSKNGKRTITGNVVKSPAKNSCYF